MSIFAKSHLSLKYGSSLSEQSEIILRPATPPETWSVIHPDLKTDASLSSQAGNKIFYVVCSLVMVLIASGCVAMFSNHAMALVTFGCGLAATVRFATMPDKAAAYARYASWIEQTVKPEVADIELKRKGVGDYRKDFYFVKVTDGAGEEELYDVKLYKLENADSIPVGRTEEVQVYRDPINKQVVLATRGGTRYWLHEFAG